MILGEVINEKYKVVAKLGFGSASTIWCCRTLTSNKYAALKIYAHDLVAEDGIGNEATIYKHLSTAGDPNHPGKISVNFGIPKMFGRPILCDFSFARNGQIEHCHDIQPDSYRAPEVILEMPWGYPVDIWSVGVMTWDMFENRRLFDGFDTETGKYQNRFHLASIVGLLGPPPLEFLERSEYSSVYFDDRGNWKCVNSVLPVSWEDSERNLNGSSKKGSLDFVRKMVRWMPESRGAVTKQVRGWSVDLQYWV
ncbi:hypothetical protein V491_01094 [Pseudogymnoascus sp. VKM F-3775]|nr:hypothetical protein V491_01094 [Pseudogymnoascus sp. VKM F-3775]